MDTALYGGSCYKKGLLFYNDGSILIANKCRGACDSRLRGSHLTSTHIPDLDNANVGNFASVTGDFQIGSLPFLFQGV